MHGNIKYIFNVGQSVNKYYKLAVNFLADFLYDYLYTIIELPSIEIQLTLYVHINL